MTAAEATSAALRLGMDDLGWMTERLTEAFLAEATIDRLFPGPERRRQAGYFFRCSCAYALHFGECHASADRQGVALWLLPGKTDMTLGRMYQAGMLSAPWRLGLTTFSRFMGFVAHADKLHKAAAPMPHYYLFALGVHPSAQGQGIGGTLLRHMLDRADREQAPIYLETQSARNVELYRRFGFDVAAHEPFPKLHDLDNWGMLRQPAK